MITLSLLLELTLVSFYALPSISFASTFSYMHVHYPNVTTTECGLTSSLNDCWKHSIYNQRDQTGQPPRACYGEFPFVASLQTWNVIDYKLTHFCGATIINEHWLLTAAHCLEGEETSQVYIQIGSNRLYDLNVTHLIRPDKFLFHQKYLSLQNNERYNYNIALIRVKSKMKMNIWMDVDMDMSKNKPNVSSNGSSSSENDTNNTSKRQINSVCLPQKDDHHQENFNEKGVVGDTPDDDDHLNMILPSWGFTRASKFLEPPEYLLRIHMKILPPNRTFEMFNTRCDKLLAASSTLCAVNAFADRKSRVCEVSIDRVGAI